MRENNTDFLLSGVRHLAEDWMTLLDASVAAYLDHARQNEETFTKADRFTERIVEEILEDEEEVHSESEEIFD